MRGREWGEGRKDIFSGQVLLTFVQNELEVGGGGIGGGGEGREGREKRRKSATFWGQVRIVHIVQDREGRGYDEKERPV